MGKITDGLEKWVIEREKKQKKRRQDTSAVEFLAIKADVKEAIEKGYSLRTIWEYLKEQGLFKATYETFRRHVKRFIKTPPKEPKILAAKKNDADKQKVERISTTHQKPEAKDNHPSKIGGFSFNAKPNKEDLI